jgi:hypothetical protein
MKCETAEGGETLNFIKRTFEMFENQKSPAICTNLSPMNKEHKILQTC